MLPDHHPGWRNILFLCVAGIILSYGLYTPLLGVQDLAPFENRNLASAPAINSLKDLVGLPAQVDAYLADHLALRNQMISAAYAFRRGALAETVFPSVVIGKDGWLLYTGRGSMENYQKANPFSPGEVATIHKNLADIKRQLETQGIKLYIMVVPIKETIYPEYVPDDIPVIGQYSRLDQLLADFKQNPALDVLDLHGPLLSSKNQGYLYYKSDTHWNPLGCQIGYYALMSQVARDYPQVRPHPLSDYTVENTEYRGDLARFLSLPEDWKESAIRLKPNYTRLSQDIPPGEQQLATTTVADPNLPKAVVFRDSFMDCLIPMVSEHFQRATYDWTPVVNYDLVRQEKPDVVIIEIVERNLHLLLQPAVGKPFNP